MNNLFSNIAFCYLGKASLLNWCGDKGTKSSSILSLQKSDHLWVRREQSIFPPFHWKVYGKSDDVAYIPFRDGGTNCVTSKMELFVTKENGFQPLSIAVKICILDLARFLVLSHLKIKSIDYIAIYCRSQRQFLPHF